MQTQTLKQVAKTEAGCNLAAAQFTEPSPRRIFTLPKFAERHCSFLSLAALTNQVFKAKVRHSSKGVIAGNGLEEAGAIVRLNRRVLIDEDRYFQWVDSQQQRSVR
jgi:hypothetical protein